MTAVFNIKIGYGEKEVTLTILPTDDHYYKVIYFGGIMGALSFNGEEWELIEKEDLESGDLPFYEPKMKGDRLEIVLNEPTINAIGLEIEQYYGQEDD